jgi:hypothetical protein
MAWHLAFRRFPYPFPGIPGFDRWTVKDWAFAGSYLMDVVFGSDHTRWKFADATLPDDDPVEAGVNDLMNQRSKLGKSALTRNH